MVELKTPSYTVYDGNQIVLQIEAEGLVTNRYLWGPAVDQILAGEHVQLGGSSAVLCTLTDHLNTVRDLAVQDAETGVTTIANHVVYDAFGRVTSQTDPTVGTLFGFTGRPFDRDTGLQNNLNRWYDAETGTWISEDPKGFAAGDANLYRYVGNAATLAADPTGLAWYNPFTWFPKWDKAVDQELAIVKQLNKMFGTRHVRLDGFTPEERVRIETALGQKIDWEGGAIRASQGALETRDKVLVGSHIALKVAEVSNDIALALTVSALAEAQAVSHAQKVAEMEQLSVEAAKNVELLELRLAQAKIDGTAAERATLRYLLTESRNALKAARNFLGR